MLTHRVVKLPPARGQCTLKGLLTGTRPACLTTLAVSPARRACGWEPASHEQSDQSSADLGLVRHARSATHASVQLKLQMYSVITCRTVPARTKG